MRLDAALIELEFSKDWTPASRKWFTGRIGTFIKWAVDQGITEIEDVTAPLVRRYIDYRRTIPSESTGKLISSWTLYGHVLAIKDLLNWAVREDLLDEKIVKRIERPKRDQKVIAVFTPRQIFILADKEDCLVPEVFRGVFVVSKETIKDVITLSDVNALL